MKVLILYRPNSEHARQVEEFVHDLQQQHGVDEHRVQLLNIDSRDGSATASLYDVLACPAILVITDEGGYIKSWDGAALPRLEEVAGYTFAY